MIGEIDIFDNIMNKILSKQNYKKIDTRVYSKPFTKGKIITSIKYDANFQIYLEIDVEGNTEARYFQDDEELFFLLVSIANSKVYELVTTMGEYPRGTRLLMNELTKGVLVTPLKNIQIELKYAEAI